MRPLIGLTTSEIRRPEPGEQIPHADAGQEQIVLGAGYISALAAAGAAPVVIPPIDPETVPSYLTGLAGVCLSLRTSATAPDTPWCPRPWSPALDR